MKEKQIKLNTSSWTAGHINTQLNIILPIKSCILSDRKHANNKVNSSWWLLVWSSVVHHCVGFHRRCNVRRDLRMFYSLMSAPTTSRRRLTQCQPAVHCCCDAIAATATHNSTAGSLKVDYTQFHTTIILRHSHHHRSQAWCQMLLSAFQRTNSNDSVLNYPANCGPYWPAFRNSAHNTNTNSNWGICIPPPNIRLNAHHKANRSVLCCP